MTKHPNQITLTRRPSTASFTPSYRKRKPEAWGCVRCENVTLNPGLFCFACRSEVKLRP